MEWIADPQAWIALLTLTALEIVLGIDNIIFMGEGLDLHIPKGYIYFAMAFSVVVEMLNMKIRARAKSAGPLKLRKSMREEE